MTEPDLCRGALIPSNLSRRGHTGRSAIDNEVRFREALSLKNAYMQHTLQVFEKDIATCR
jgi:hypothetical protein